MKLSEFYRTFSNEKSCVNYLKKSVENKGLCCSKCSSDELIWSYKNKGWRCCNCRKKISLKSVTFMRDSHVSFKNWMEILYLTCDFKKSPSICEIHRQSSLKRYETVYYMVQKIRIEMGDIIGKEFFEYNDLMEFDLHSKSNPLSMCEVYYGKSEGEKFDRIKLEIDCYSWNLADSIVHSKKKDYKMLKILFSNYGRPMFNAEAEKRWIRAKVMKYNWCKNVVGNFTRIVKGTYHHISLLHIQKAMDEYNFKYNYRKEIKSKIEIFLTKMSLLNGQTSG